MEPKFERNEEQKFYFNISIGLLIGYPLFVFFIYALDISRMATFLAFCSCPLWFIPSMICYSLSEDWTKEQRKEASLRAMNELLSKKSDQQEKNKEEK